MPTLTANDGTELACHVRGDGPPSAVLPGGPMRASAYALSAHRTLYLLAPPATRTAPAGLAAPVLVLACVLHGGPRPALARRCADAFPRAEAVVQPGAGHCRWLDDPRWFVRRVAASLGQG
ncbi:hypothetical protein FM21_13815 [Streptomyces mutabilis]|uniref:Alpha/beta hydrolase n=1 Tax=Streptomyces mutabilis TaxID=67332 RepID=A0A086N7G2_9ACTN|nr:hypothetical protein [Streptomyces mutabilis]KFG77080.1 hypothetical protein FM21_13815 [Streptomyces mutabilis]